MNIMLPELYNGDVLFLKEEDKQLLEEVYDETDHQIRFTKHGSGSDSEDDIDENLIHTITILRENVVNIIEALKVCRGSKKKFLKKFPSWRETRTRNVEVLIEIGNSLHLDRKNSNISRLVGNCTSFSGAILTVVSAAMIPFTLGASTPLAIAGSAIVATGSACSVGTSITEVALLNKKTKKAQTIIDEDKEASNDLNSWLMHASVLSTALEQISNIDMVQDIMNEIRELVEKVVKIKKGEERKMIIKILVKAALLLLPGELSTLVSGISMLISMLVAIILLHDRNRLIFDCASLTFKSVLAIFSVLDSTVDIATIAAKLISGNTSVATALGKAFARGTFALLSMALDATSIILTSIDVHKGSKSEQGQQIIEAAKKLEGEVCELQKVFDYLKSGRRRKP